MWKAWNVFRVLPVGTGGGGAGGQLTLEQRLIRSELVLDVSLTDLLNFHT